LASLPVDDVPIEILVTMSHEPEAGKAEREAESYVPQGRAQG
jgi:hypothetical protein